MRFAVGASVIFYLLVAAMAVDHFVGMARCGCRTPDLPLIWPRIGLYYLIAVFAGIVFAWRDNDGDDE